MLHPVVFTSAAVFCDLKTPSLDIFSIAGIIKLPIFFGGGIKQCKHMVVLRDYPCYNALFGLVMTPVILVYHLILVPRSFPFSSRIGEEKKMDRPKTDARSFARTCGRAAFAWWLGLGWCSRPAALEGEASCDEDPTDAFAERFLDHKPNKPNKKTHVSSVQNSGWWFDIGDYTTELYGWL